MHTSKKKAANMINCINIVFTAKQSSPSFEPKYVTHKNEKVRSKVLIKISKFILNSFKSFYLIKIFSSLGINLNFLIINW